MMRLLDMGCTKMAFLLHGEGWRERPVMDCSAVTAEGLTQHMCKQQAKILLICICFSHVYNEGVLARPFELLKPLVQQMLCRPLCERAAVRHIWPKHLI